MEHPMWMPFPLSNGEIARLYLPEAMSVADARRLRRMISALYIIRRQGAEESKERTHEPQ